MMEQGTLENIIGAIGITTVFFGTVALGITGFKVGKEHIELLKEVGSNPSQCYQAATYLTSTVISTVGGAIGGNLVRKALKYYFMC